LFDGIHAFPFGLTYDDAYFYAQIAYNMGHQGQSSFDGIHPTSGYHLAWGALLGGLAALIDIFTASKNVHLYFFQVFFASLAVAGSWRFARGAIERFGFLVLVVMSTLLMETLLLSLLLLAIGEQATRAERDRRTHLYGSLLVFLVPLVRIDAAVILLVYVAFLTLEGELGESVKTALALGAGVATQLGIMYMLFGELWSVSSLIKASNSSWLGGLAASITGPEPGIATGYVIRFALFLGLMGSVVATGLTVSNLRVRRRWIYLSLGAGAFAFGHAATHLMPFWCYLPAHLLALRTITCCGLPVRLRRLVLYSVAVLGVAFLAHKVRVHNQNLDVSAGARDFVARLRDHVPRDGRIYQIDGSGFTGYFSERTVVNGDGLVNSHEYARRLRAGQLAGYLDEEGICFIVSNRAHEDRIVDIGGLVVSSVDVDEVFRTQAWGRFPTTDFILYRLRRERCPGESSAAPSGPGFGRAPDERAVRPHQHRGDPQPDEHDSDVQYGEAPDLQGEPARSREHHEGAHHVSEPHEEAIDRLLRLVLFRTGRRQPQQLASSVHHRVVRAVLRGLDPAHDGQ